MEQFEQLFYMLKYLAFVFIEGDASNDWLTYLPVDIAEHLYQIGDWMTGILF